MNEEKDIALIVSYLEGTLTSVEKTVLEERLSQEPELQQLLQDMNVLKAGIKQAAREEIQSELKAVEHKLTSSTSSSSLKSNWIKIAATLAIVAVASWLLWPPATKTPQELFAENYEPYPNIIMPTVRGSQAPNLTVLPQAYKAYDMQEYDKAIELFESLAEKDEGVLLYLGNSYLANGEPEKAIPIFEKALKDFDMFEEQTAWYLALSHLKLGEMEKTENILKKLTMQSDSYQTKAQMLIEKLHQTKK